MPWDEPVPEGPVVVRCTWDYYESLALKDKFVGTLAGLKVCVPVCVRGVILAGTGV